jgi:hypothetical protein
MHGGRYEGRGLFLEPPSMAMTKGVWKIQTPAALEGIIAPGDLDFPSRDALYDLDR